MLMWQQKAKNDDFWTETKSSVSVRRLFVKEYGLKGSEIKNAPDNKAIDRIV